MEKKGDKVDSESDKSGFFYLKWEEHFFDDHKLRCLSGRGDTISCTLGDYAILLYVRLVNESISHGGRLRYSKKQPYTDDILSCLFGMNEESLKKAKDLLVTSELIEIEEDGTIVIPHVFNKIKTETAAAATMRKMRQKSKTENATHTGREKRSQSYNNVKHRDNKVEQSENNVAYSIQSTVNSLQLTDNINTPQKPPQGGTDDVRGCEEGSQSGGDDLFTSAADRTNGAAGFAAPKERREGLEYPLVRIQRAFDEARNLYVGKLSEENREVFCKYIFNNVKLENSRSRISLPARIKELYDKWLADGGPHMDAPQITREELAEWVREYNPKAKDDLRITPEMEDGFWAWLVAVGFKNGKGLRMTKWNIGRTISAWVENRRKDAGKDGRNSPSNNPVKSSVNFCQDQFIEFRS